MPFSNGIITLAAVAALVGLPGQARAADKPPASIGLDLSAGVLSQTNCKTSVGCGHPQVTIGSSSVTSGATAASPAQHILSLQFTNLTDLQRLGKGPSTLDLEYELANPSGHKNNLLCASALVDGQLIQRCANAYSQGGRLSVPLHSPPTKIALQFGLMPWSAGHRFHVKNVRVSFGKSVERVEKAKGGSVDLTDGRLLQPGCVTPIGCTHTAVTLTPNALTSIVAGQSNDKPPVPTDNPNQPPSDNPPSIGRSLSLEVPVPALGKSLKSLSFAYQVKNDGQTGAPRIVVTARGRTSVQAVLDQPGSGLVSIALPESSLPIETVTFDLTTRTGDRVRFDVASVSLGPRPAEGALPVPATEDCEGCEGAVSRRDPCGPELLTFWVTAADSREGRGFRCVSNDLRSWYGEGWWIDPSYGWYRHLGYIPDATFGFPPGFAIAVDFGVTPLPAEGDGGLRAAYGTRGGQALQIDRTMLDRWHVFTSSRSWDEEWQLVPKGDLLPSFVGSVRWENYCGPFGLYSFEALSSTLAYLKRCAMPADLTADPTNLRVTSLPLVWYGQSYVRDPLSDHREEPGFPERTHLGWLTRFAARPSPPGVYAASDRCLAAPRVDACTSFTDVTAEIIGHGATDYPPGAPQDHWENEFLRDHQGLYVIGPGVWGAGGEGHAWIRYLGLPPDASLPPPTPVCLDSADCP